MKKRLALLLSVAMAFSMFANVAFGATNELTTTEKYEALVQAGIFNGVPGADGKVDPQLNVQTDRAQFAKILALTTGLEQVTGKESFKDQNYSKHWAKGYIEAVVEAGYMNGVGNSKFDLKGKVTAEQVAKAFMIALGMEPVADAPAVEGASKWAYGYIAAAKAAGLDETILGGGKWNAPVNRAVLVEVAYAVKEISGVKVDKVQVIDANNVVVTFSDKEEVKVKLETALVEGVKTTIDVKKGDKTYKVDVTLEAVSATAKLVGAKKVEVTFNRAVDTAKAVVEVKNSTGSKMNVAKTTYNDTKTVATVEFTNSLLKGDYTVAVTGLKTDAINAGKFSVEDEKITKIEFLDDRAVLDRNDKGQFTVSVSIKISNQYEEDITSAKIGGLTVNTARGAEFSKKDNKIVIKDSINAFKLGDKFAVSIFDGQSTLFESKVVTVTEKSSINEIAVKEIFSRDDSTLTATKNGDSIKDKNYYLVIEAKDQYGNAITDPKILAEDASVQISGGTNLTYGTSTVGTATYADFQTIKINKEDKIVLPLTAFAQNNIKNVNAGKAYVNIVSITTGKRATYEFEVRDNIKVAQLNVSAPSVAVAGEIIEIPFTAVDQFGKEITKAADLNAGMQSMGFGNLDPKKVYFEQDHVKNVAKLKIDTKGMNKGTVMFTAVTGANSNLVTLSVNLLETAKVDKVGGLKDVSFNMAQGAVTSVKRSNIIVNDQYGRGFDAWKTDYTVKLTSADPEIIAFTADKKQASAEIKGDAAVEVHAVGKGYTSITVELVNSKGETVSSTRYLADASVVEKANLDKYAPSVTGAVYSPDLENTKYGKEVVVKGSTANGTEYKLPADYFDVKTTDNTVVARVVDGVWKVFAKGDSNFDNGKKEVTLLINVKANGDNVALTQKVEVLRATPKATTLTLSGKDAAGANIFTKESDLVVSVAPGTKLTQAVIDAALTDAIKAVDQYGVELDQDTYATVVNLTDAKLAELKAGDKVSVTAIANNGASAQITFSIILK